MRSIGILLLSVMGIASTAAAADRVPVAVSILPQATFVERVGGEHVDVTVMVGTGQSPHAYDPTPRQIAGLSRAKLYFRTGVGFEDGFMSRIERLYPKMRVIDLRDGIKLRKVEAECTHEHGAHTDKDHKHADHEHGPGCDHDHGSHDHGKDKHGEDHGHGEEGDGHKHEHGPDCDHDHGDHDHGHKGGGHKHAHDGDDPHIWLSPKLAKHQAKTICDALCKIDPARSKAYRSNLEEFQAELDRVHDEIAASLKPLKGKSVYVFHPAFGYFLDEFGLKQVPVELEGKQPSARQLARLIDQAKADRVRVIFVQPQFSPKSAQAVAEAIGGAVVPINPLAKEYTANLREIARQIREGLSPAKP